MSFANTRLKLDSPASALLDSSESSAVHLDQEHEAVQRFTFAQLSTEPVIAVDLDDVLSQSNQAVANCKSRRVDIFELDYERRDTGHNSKYGTQMNLCHFYCKSLIFI